MGTCAASRSRCVLVDPNADASVIAGSSCISSSIAVSSWWRKWSTSCDTSVPHRPWPSSTQNKAVPRRPAKGCATAAQSWLTLFTAPSSPSSAP
eukprot:234968-Prymnesium_polylepis.2